MSNTYYGIGLMSGTSLDGLDIAFCKFERTKSHWHYGLLNTACSKFPSELEKKLRLAKNLSSEELLKLDVDFGKWIGVEVEKFITRENISPQFIASHGYTVFHQPERGFTLQIGSTEEVHKATGVPVINNFRQLDVSLGGQGAPLVPVGDQLLFGEYDLCLNLGGIANISYDQNEECIAYDICPANMVLNFIAQRKDKDYDENGKLAEKGKLLPKLYEQLESLSYYNSAKPKSLGAEWVQHEVLSMEAFNTESPEDLLCTFVYHIASRIKHAVSMSSFSKKDSTNILITGGGAHNSFLLNEIEKELPKNFTLIKPDAILIDYKEALVFAFLGVLRLRGDMNCLKSVTGAAKDSCGGNLIGVNPYQ